MKSLLAALTSLLLLSSSTHAQSANNTYDSVLAKKLGGDDYGMKKYIFVMLKTGTATETDTLKVNNIFRGHMKNIQSLAEQGKLVVAGPLGSNDKKYEGIFVFNTSSMDEAKQMLATDPAVQANLLEADMFLWYCSAALMEINNIHNKIQKKHF